LDAGFWRVVCERGILESYWGIPNDSVSIPVYWQRRLEYSHYDLRFWKISRGWWILENLCLESGFGKVSFILWILESRFRKMESEMLLFESRFFF